MNAVGADDQPGFGGPAAFELHLDTLAALRQLRPSLAKLDNIRLDGADRIDRDTGDADTIALARTILYDPRWPWHAAAHFGAHVKAPDQYLRSQPRQYPDLFDIGH